MTNIDLINLRPEVSTTSSTSYPPAGWHDHLTGGAKQNHFHAITLIGALGARMASFLQSRVPQAA